MNYTLRITTANGIQSSHPLIAPQVTIGSGVGADIRLDGQVGLLPQHVLIAAQPEQCWVSTIAGSPLWDHSGAAVSNVFVSWGARLTLGECVFELQKSAEVEEQAGGNPRREVADTSDESDKPARYGVHPGLLMLLIATLVYTAIDGFEGSNRRTAGGLSEAPALFAEVTRTCQSRNSTHRAPIAEEQALAKSERAVFDLRDGVLALELFSEAEDCYRKAGRLSEAEHVAKVGETFRSSMQEQYDLLRLRLARDLAADNKGSAQIQVQRLSELLAHRSDSEYGQALRRLSARLSIQGPTQ